MKYFWLFITFLSFFFSQAQAGMTVSPGKLFFYGTEGASVPQKIKIINPTDRELEVGISINDWQYDDKGGNVITAFNSIPQSCAGWVRILPGTHISIPGNSFKEVEVTLQVPDKSSVQHPVHTAMVFLTQLNPGSSTDASGAAIKVAVRIGVKIYHTAQETTGLIAVKDLTAMKNNDGEKVVLLSYENQGNIWTDGKISWSVFSFQTGKSITIGEEEFYTLPNDQRQAQTILPADLPSGRYSVTARITTDKNNAVQLAEMDFEI